MADYEIYAVRYGEHMDRYQSQNFLTTDPHENPIMPMDFSVWAIVGGGKTFIVDSGFNPETGVKRQRKVTRPVGEGLKAAGFNCEAIEDVIVTHMHYDHVGNHELFPNARYHIQEKEMSYCTGACMCHHSLNHPFEVDDVVTMVRRVFAGRVKFHDGSAEIAPDLSVHLVGGHSQGLQVVRVRTKRGWVVLASDTSHYYANFETGRPFPIIVSMEHMMRGFDTLRQLASSDAHIIPGHDPLVMKRYPAAKPGLEGVVRLDPPPQ